MPVSAANSCRGRPATGAELPYGASDMTYKFGLNLPIEGGNKLARFKLWAESVLPDLEYRLPPQTPIKTEAMTIRLRSLDDGDRVRAALRESRP